MLTNRTFSAKAYDAKYYETLDEGVPASSGKRAISKRKRVKAVPLRLGHGYSQFERELIQALRNARALLCSEGDPEEDGAMIEQIDALFKRLGIIR